MIEKWLERINNMLDLQKQIQVETIAASFTERDLKELRMILNTAQFYIDRDKERMQDVTD